MERILKCKLFKVNDEGKLMPRSVLFTDDVSERYELDDTTYDFMLNELQEYGRYWLTDEEVISVLKE